MEVLGHLASLLVVKAIIQMEGIEAPNHNIQLSGVIDSEVVLYRAVYPHSQAERSSLLPA
jgi:hypothetical protein